MRCPKCSFISFDIVESCAKCGKNISKAAEELMGTIAEVVAPRFLKFEAGEPEPGAATYEEPEELSNEEVAVDLSDEEQEDVDFSLEEAVPEAEAVEFDISEEVSVEGEPEIDLANEELEGEVIGISDLAPSDEVVEEAIEDDLIFDDASVDEAAPLTDHEAGELEDLEVDGIDLGTPAAGGKVMPSVKTGTALDDFDIDLGDLIPGKKDE